MTVKNQSEASLLASLPQAKRNQILANLSEAEWEELRYDWKFWARPNQLPPEGDWTYWLIMAGRGFGKTRTGAEWVRAKAQTGNYVNLIGATADDARDIMVEGESGILTICHPDERPYYKKSERKLIWPNGAESLIFTADEPERLRGKQHSALWCLTGDTLVTMGDLSQKRISDLTDRDYVMTRKGPHRVVAQMKTRRDAEIYKLDTLGGQSITGTYDHPVWVEGKGFLPLGSLQEGMSVCVISASTGAERSGTDTATGIIRRLFDCIVKCGSQSMEQSQTDSTFTIKTETSQTTESKTLNFYHTVNTADCTLPQSSILIVRNLLRHLKKRERVTRGSDLNASSSVFVAGKNTTAQRHIPQCFVRQRVLKKSDQALLTERIASASNAASGTTQPNEHRGIVQENATQEQQRIVKKQQPEKLLAPIVVLLSRLKDQMRAFVVGRVPLLITTKVASVRKLSRREDVYDIAVEWGREFFANGILVHNCDELGAWRYADAWDQAMFGLRLGMNPQAVITTTPRPIKLLIDLIKDPGTHLTTGTSYENRENLAPTFFSKLVSKYEGTRLGRQELKAELLEDIPGALWNRGILDELRVKDIPTLRRIVVAIDPAVSTNEGSDETGIIVAGIAENNHIYVLSDKSGRKTPSEWAKEAVAQYNLWKADRIIGEANQGGDLVERNLRVEGGSVPVRLVHASKGKFTRAEPVSALYEQRRVHHVGCFGALEDQMTQFTQDFDRKMNGSPDRVDALVWAITDLAVLGNVGDSLLSYYRQKEVKK